MLSIQAIKAKYTDEIFRKNPKAVLVEYLQHEFLDSIFKQVNSELLSFIGGTAIRIVYNSLRFSEDLDFDNLGLSYKKFINLIENAIRDMKNKGFEIDSRFIKKGAYHCYVKFSNLLFENNISGHKSEKILIRIDTVYKNISFQQEIFTLNSFGIYRKIKVNSPDIVLSQKLVTILQRKREKGRDFYDVSYLLGITKPNYDFIERILKISSKEFKTKLIKKISQLNMIQLSNDVLPFLINPDDKERVVSFKEYIEQEL